MALQQVFNNMNLLMDFQGNGSKENGFTLIELLIIISVMTILSTLSVTSFRTFSTRSEQTTVAHIVLGALKEAQARTLASYDDTTYGVHFETSKVTIFKGAVYNSSDPDNEERVFPARTSITNISLSGGSTDVIFARLTGKTSSTGTITVAVTSDASTSQIITIYDSGLSEITG